VLFGYLLRELLCCVSLWLFYFIFSHFPHLLFVLFYVWAGVVLFLLLRGFIYYLALGCVW
jgi:hypothetical protein